MKIKQNINIAVLFLIAVFLLSGCKKNDISNDSGNIVANGPLCFTAEEPGASIGMFFNTMYGWIFDTVTKPNIEYSFDKVNWETLTISSISKDTTNSIVLENVGDKVYFRGENPHGLNPNYYDDMESCFSFLTNEKRIAISGNVMSLIDTTCNSKTAPDYCFIKLFDYTSITSAPELPATTVGKRSYQGMFLSCKNLADAPKLPAKTLSECCYLSMFAYCSGLTTAPKLPATTLAYGCYSSMFYYCNNLVKAPDLPATTLAESCYSGMFFGCVSLTTPPALPATTLAAGCYALMFESCPSLTYAPELPATTLAEHCYEEMFTWCGNLTSAPELPATVLAESCYCRMFQGCTHLTTAPALPATTLAVDCYFCMFDWCWSLTSAPELPASVLPDFCYAGMFSRCANITSVKVHFTEWSYATNGWFAEVGTNGVFYCPASLPQEFGESRIPEGWTVETF